MIFLLNHQLMVSFIFYKTFLLFSYMYFKLIYNIKYQMNKK